MTAIKIDSTVYIASDFVDAVDLSKGNGKGYRVTHLTSHKSAIVRAATGDIACTLLGQALKSERISASGGFSFQAI